MPGKNIDPIDYKSISILLISCIVVISVAAFLSFKSCKNNKFENCEEEDITFGEWFNGTNLDLKSIVVGMTSGVVFGFVDNAGLFLGMDKLDSLFQRLPLGNEVNVKAGYGNTFSDMIGAFLSTFIGRQIVYKTGVTEYPMWSEAIGIVVGCLLGIFIPRMIISPK